MGLLSSWWRETSKWGFHDSDEYVSLGVRCAVREAFPEGVCRGEASGRKSDSSFTLWNENARVLRNYTFGGVVGAFREGGGRSGARGVAVVRGPVMPRDTDAAQARVRLGIRILRRPGDA